MGFDVLLCTPPCSSRLESSSCVSTADKKTSDPHRCDVQMPHVTAFVGIFLPPHPSMDEHAVKPHPGPVTDFVCGLTDRGGPGGWDGGRGLRGCVCLGGFLPVSNGSFAAWRAGSITLMCLFRQQFLPWLCARGTCLSRCPKLR